MERSEQEIEKLLGWAQSSPEEAGREIMRLEDLIERLTRALTLIAELTPDDDAVTIARDALAGHAV